MGTSFTLDYFKIINTITYKGFVYARQSSLTRERTNSNTFINWSMVSQVTCFSLPSLEYRYTVLLRGSTTQRDRVSSSIGSSVDYSSIIARQRRSCQERVTIPVLTVPSVPFTRIVNVVSLVNSKENEESDVGFVVEVRPTVVIPVITTFPLTSSF